MENKNESQNKNRKRGIITYLVVGIIILGFGYLYGLPIIKQKIGEKRVDNLVKALKQSEEEDYKLALADTYGGKTPQETLDMYIGAVEKGDYELASKYMVIPKQKEEHDNLKVANKNNIKKFIDILKTAELVDKEIGATESYKNATGILRSPEIEKEWIRTYMETNANRESMEIELEEGTMTVSFWKYPSGNWKIQDF